VPQEKPETRQDASAVVLPELPECWSGTTLGAELLTILWILLGTVAFFLVFNLGWRWASRVWSLPCPSLTAWRFDNPLVRRLTRTTLDRLELRPGQRILEIGPGPGRLLILAAQRVLPDGEAVGIDIQQAMIDRLKDRAEKAGVTNLKAILGDATQPHVPEASFDLVYVSLALGEIPDRAAALSQCYRALKPGGVLSITEIIGDPHYQFRSFVERLAEAAGFRLRSITGKWWFYTATFIKS
jgi:SAM-dependent methyltransferase